MSFMNGAWVQGEDGKLYKVIGSVRRGLAMKLVRDKRDVIAQELQKVVLLGEANKVLVKRLQKRIRELRSDLNLAKGKAQRERRGRP